MRFLTLLATAITLTLITTEDAEARRGGTSGYSESLGLVSDTNIVNDGVAYSLCHLTKTHNVIFANVWRTSKGYVLAADRCEAERFYPISEEQVIAAQVVGEIPDTVPSVARLNMNEILSGFWGLAAIGGLLVLAGFKMADRAARTRRRQGEMTGAAPVAIKIADAMCHAAKADGSLDEEEIKIIADITEKMTGAAFDRARIQRMYELAEAKPTDAQFASFGKGLPLDQRRLVMQATLMIVAADGNIDRQENAFVQKLARGLSLDANEVQGMFRSISATPV
ncbi:TerB family tellurite resistance protein [Ruegeria sp. 2012CJ41-6]|uniref:TerB family tellurite resistance protein n=1 Tax=Ruegeria spongiae TaxID=2942209 RepID=A0ABT0PZ27_9RHOB|nr:DUF533 domain-containing protein [Ruegeria spongiae]MCL6282879.1 TerB family tellurite resistance protein [Ruegeria spongiae]